MLKNLIELEYLDIDVSIKILNNFSGKQIINLELYEYRTFQWRNALINYR